MPDPCLLQVVLPSRDVPVRVSTPRFRISLLVAPWHCFLGIYNRALLTTHHHPSNPGPTVWLAPSQGVTRSLIPVAAANGILAINESPNGAMAATNLPPAFIWKDGGIATNASGVDGVVPASQQEILTMWWEGSCDTYCFRAYPGCDMAVSYDWRGEDSGPNVGRAEDILGMYAAARARQLRHHFGPCLTQLSNLSWVPSFLFPPPLALQWPLYSGANAYRMLIRCLKHPMV